MLFAHLASMSPINEREVFESITLLRLPSLISLGAIMGRIHLLLLDHIPSRRLKLSNFQENILSISFQTSIFVK